MKDRRFGIVYNALQPFETLKAVQLADKSGYRLAGSYDSQFLWLDPWIHYANWVASTSEILCGPFVTNTLTRHVTVTACAAATLDLYSSGRAFIGIGRGDSSVRMIGRKPIGLQEFESEIQRIRLLTSGQSTKIGGAEVRIPWARRGVPIYVAGYGPKVLRLAGRVGDGVIIQVADAETIQWCMRWVHEGAKEVGRDLSGFEVISASSWYYGKDPQKARREVRWFPGIVSNHALDLIRTYPKEVLPPTLIAGMEARGSYDYWEHANKDAHDLDFVTDDMIDRFCVIGSAESMITRLEELWKAGVTMAVAYAFSEDYYEQTKLIAEGVVSRYHSG